MITRAATSQRNRNWDSVVDVVIVWVVALVLLTSAIDKVFHYTGFVQALKNYVLVPAYTADLIAPVVILLELFLGASLLVRKTRRQAAIGAGGLFVVFSAALVGNRLAGEEGICGCWFTITLAEGAVSHIALNLLIAMLCFFVYLAESYHFGYASRASRGTPRIAAQLTERNEK